MTVKELIEQFNGLPQDQQVYSWDPILEHHAPIKAIVLGNAKISESVQTSPDITEAIYTRAYLVKT